MSALLDKHRAGGVVTSIDKIGSLACPDEVAGYKSAAQKYGPALTDDERGALARRSAEIRKARGWT